MMVRESSVAYKEDQRNRVGGATSAVPRQLTESPTACGIQSEDVSSSVNPECAPPVPLASKPAQGVWERDVASPTKPCNPAPVESASNQSLLPFALLPFLAWWTHVYTITTRRVIERTGIFVARRRELSHVRGYTIGMRRGILQRMWGAGTLTLSNGVDAPLRLVNVPSAALVHEVLVDQVEVNQILAHRDAQSLPPGPPPPLPRR